MFKIILPFSKADAIGAKIIRSIRLIDVRFIETFLLDYINQFVSKMLKSYPL